ncbi:MAG: hypothetical protein Q9226_007467, partial [Calogaya cf. arnoldii]
MDVWWRNALAAGILVVTLSVIILRRGDIVTQCIVRPRNAREVAIAVKIVKRGYDDSNRLGAVRALFVVRSGGHSPIPGAANIDGGIVIDLQLLNEVVPSEDGSCVIMGTGARWLDVSTILDHKCLAVAGGQNSAVGVGGLTLGGGISFFSPRVGFVCNNILSYEVVLANGTRATASEKTNPGLWRALKGGSNNFGMVTSFVARSFLSTKIWSGFLYMTASKASQVIQAFHAHAQAKTGTNDEYAAGPLSSPAGLRQKFVTTTVKNDLATLMEIDTAYKETAKVMHDELVDQTTHGIIDGIRHYAASKGFADPYR